MTTLRINRLCNSDHKAGNSGFPAAQPAGSLRTPGSFCWAKTIRTSENRSSGRAHASMMNQKKTAQRAQSSSVRSGSEQMSYFFLAAVFFAGAFLAVFFSAFDFSISASIRPVIYPFTLSCFSSQAMIFFSFSLP